jgi:hypothetical protein
VPDEPAQTAGDGIAELGQIRDQRLRQRRAPLPPRHPRAEEPAAAAQPPAPASAAPGAAEQAQAARRRARKRPERSEAESVPLRLGQFYVTADQDEALRRIRAEGLMSNMDVSGSAVVRYALDQLLAAKTPAELVRLLGTPKGQKQDRRGRPRR